MSRRMYVAAYAGLIATLAVFVTVYVVNPPDATGLSALGRATGGLLAAAVVGAVIFGAAWAITGEYMAQQPADGAYAARVMAGIVGLVVFAASVSQFPVDGPWGTTGRYVGAGMLGLVFFVISRVAVDREERV